MDNETKKRGFFREFFSQLWDNSIDDEQEEELPKECKEILNKIDKKEANLGGRGIKLAKLKVNHEEAAKKANINYKTSKVEKRKDKDLEQEK